MCAPPLTDRCSEGATTRVTITSTPQHRSRRSCSRSRRAGCRAVSRSCTRRCTRSSAGRSMRSLPGCCASPPTSRTWGSARRPPPPAAGSCKPRSLRATARSQRAITKQQYPLSAHGPRPLHHWGESTRRRGYRISAFATFVRTLHHQAPVCIFCNILRTFVTSVDIQAEFGQKQDDRWLEIRALEHTRFRRDAG